MTTALLSARAGPAAATHCSSASRRAPTARSARSAAVAPLRAARPAAPGRACTSTRRSPAAPKAVLDVDESTFEAEVLKVSVFFVAPLSLSPRVRPAPAVRLA